MTITETVLEMHYHRPMMDLIRETYGLGSGGKFNFYKYSPQREVYIGFDQAFAMTELSDADFFSMLRQSAMQSSYQLPSRFVAYFLQYKVVTELQRFQSQTPPTIRSRPHFRATLDTTKNDRTGFSQHELLFNLHHNDAAMVYYACPMLFDKAALYEIEVNLDSLRLVDLASCPSDFSDNSKHYIYFDQTNADPIWCSEPVDGKARTPEQFADQVVAQLRGLPPAESAKNLMDLLSSIKSLVKSENIFLGMNGNELAIVADSLTIVQIQESSNEA
jgi:hypothetical protein